MRISSASRFRSPISVRSAICASRNGCSNLHLGPLTQQVVIHAGQRYGRGMIRKIAGDSLNRHIEVEQQSATAVLPNHALNPEERSDARATCYGLHVMKAG